MKKLVFRMSLATWSLKRKIKKLKAYGTTFRDLVISKPNPDEQATAFFKQKMESQLGDLDELIEEIDKGENINPAFKGDLEELQRGEDQFNKFNRRGDYKHLDDRDIAKLQGIVKKMADLAKEALAGLQAAGFAFK